MYSEIIWIKDHLYQENYHNVIEPFINYSGNRVDLTSPIYEYKEKMKHFFKRSLFHETKIYEYG